MNKTEGQRIRELIEAVCLEWGIATKSVFARVQFREYVCARHMITLALREEYRWTITRIAHLMHRDPSTIWHSLDAASDLIDTDMAFKATYKRIVAHNSK